jgi:hypothetical protein
MYRKPTDKEREKISSARKRTRQGMEGQKDFLSKISTTMAKDARDEEKMGRKMMESVPQAARNYEMEEGQGASPFKKGGKVMKEGKMMKKEGRGMAKAAMQKVAGKAVKGHEERMHGAKKKMMMGGMTKGYEAGGKIDGCATKGKTKGTMIKMAGGGKC